MSDCDNARSSCRVPRPRAVRRGGRRRRGASNGCDYCRRRYRFEESLRVYVRTTAAERMPPGLMEKLAQLARAARTTGRCRPGGLGRFRRTPQWRPEGVHSPRPATRCAGRVDVARGARGRRTGRAAARRRAAPSSGISVPARPARRGAGGPRTPPYDAATTSPPVARRQLSTTRATAAGARSRPVGEHDDGRLDVRRRAPRARSAATPRARAPSPGSGRRGTTARDECRHEGRTPPRRRRSRRPGSPRRRSRTRGRRSACFGEPKRVAAPAARTTAATRVTGSTAVTDSTTTGWVGCSVAGSPSVPISSTTSRPVRHLADDRVVGRQADVGARDDEELAARRARRLGLRSSPSRRRPSRTRRPPPARRPSSSPGPPPPALRRVAALDHEAGDDPVEDRVVEEARLRRARRARRTVAGAASRSSVDDEASRRTCRTSASTSSRASSGSVGAVAPPSSRGAGASTSRALGRRRSSSPSPSRSTRRSSPPQPAASERKQRAAKPWRRARTRGG